ncbi:MAG: aconitate hydratase AcnA [Gammaproteobacteria bacterium]|nr:aconitate hydratase AcnA [Gammaproteobacteria bacterium]MDE0251692.1 aconitate hydratase AcnA [Gammaproteobacteria bacterium]MDE0403299.1 aconitate hydratase AcnA [Gammaproteobacteria bacterium]
MSENSFNSRTKLTVNDREYVYFDLHTACQEVNGDLFRLPMCHRILLENLLRHEDNLTVVADDIQYLAGKSSDSCNDRELFFRPARVLMQDFTGVPAIADLAAMRDAVLEKGLDPTIINPQVPVDLVIDHSVMVDRFGSAEAFDANVEREIQRNEERYRFLRWGQNAFSNFRVVPPGTGICHQVNLEYLARVVWTTDFENSVSVFPDTLVGTDSHTTMINGLGVLGWGVGGIEAEAAMLGQSISMLLPRVVGMKITGELREGVTATDVVLRVVEVLRATGVVGAFVEFFGSGLDQLALADRATIANMAPEYGATCGYFPVDKETLSYLKLTARPRELINLVESYTKQQGLWRDDSSIPEYTSIIELELGSIEPSVAGPKRPQDRVPVDRLKSAFELTAMTNGASNSSEHKWTEIDGQRFQLDHGDTVIAAITSCTNTSNPSVMLAAGLVAQKALKRGLTVKPWVKTSLAPGSKVVTEYLKKTGLQESLDEIGFNLVGYGCTTCIGNSGPLSAPISAAIKADNLVVSSVLSGNRNFEGRVHQEVRANWLASPPLVVAYALAGTTRINLDQEPLGQDETGNPVYLREIWPSNAEIRELVNQVSSDMFIEQYADIFSGPPAWQSFNVTDQPNYHWDSSTYIKQPPFFTQDSNTPQSLNIESARALAMLGDSVTTDHISPAGAIQPDSPAGKYLQDNGVSIAEFNSYGSRRGNHEVMMRGTFANVRIKNEIVPGQEGGFTKCFSDEKLTTIYDAAIRYQQDSENLIIIAGKEYGAGSSRDWAAKGTLLLGIKAVITESFERIHRSNLIGMGVLPLQFLDGQSRKTLQLQGNERFSIRFLANESTLKPRQKLGLHILAPDGSENSIELQSRIDTAIELKYFQSGGILNFVLTQLVNQHTSEGKT